jgi:hypothetical protein
VDNNYLDLGMSKSGFIHTLPSGRLTLGDGLGGCGLRARLPTAHARVSCFSLSD